MHTRVPVKASSAGRTRADVQRYLSVVFATLLGIWLLLNAIHTGQSIVRFYTPLPIWDYWRVVVHLPEYQSFHLGVLWKQHNEHRIIFPEVVFAADMLLAHGRLLLPLILSSLCYVVTWFLLSSAVFSDNTVSKIDRWIAVLLAGVLAFFETVTTVLAVPFLLQWTLMQAAVASSLLFLSCLKKRESAICLLGTVVSATLATYSSGDGLILWPLIVAVALMLRLSARSLSGLSTAAILNLKLYFVGYHFMGGLDFWNFVVHPFYTLNFVVSYISMPFGVIKAYVFGLTLGFINLLLALAFVFLAWRKRRLSSRAGIVLFSYYLFTLLTALMTAAGRINFKDPSFLAAKQVRYITVPQMNWAALILIVLWISSGSKHRRVLFPAFSLFFSLGFMMAFVKLDRWFSVTTRGSFLKEQQATLSIENGNIDRELIVNYVNPDFNLVVRGLSRFASGQFVHLLSWLSRA